MAIPFANRKAWADLPAIALREKPTFTLAEIHGEFSKVLHVSLETVFECIQVVSRTKLCLTFKDKSNLEETTNIGLEFRGHPVTLTPLHSKTWVSVSRVQFGVPWDSVKAALAPYGLIDRARRETLNNVCTGTISVLMQVTKSIPSKISVAGRTCFIYYRGQPRTCFSCGETGHQKKECPHSSARVEAARALARSSTWGSQAHSEDRSTDTVLPEDSPVISGEQPDATHEGLRPDSASVSGQTSVELTSTEGEALITVPPGPISLVSGQQVEATGEQLAAEDTPAEDNSRSASAAIVLPNNLPVESILPPNAALAVPTRIVHSGANISDPHTVPEPTVTVLPPDSNIQSENSPPEATVLQESIPPYGETLSDQEEVEVMDQSIFNPSRSAPLRATDINLSETDYGIGPQVKRNKNKDKRKRLKNYQASTIAADSSSLGPWVRTRTKPSVPPNPTHHSANSFAVLTNLTTTDLSEIALSEEILPASPTEVYQSCPEPRVTEISEKDISNDEPDSLESEENYTPYVTGSGNLIPKVSRHVGPSIPNPPLPDSDSSQSSDGEVSDVERPGS